MKHVISILVENKSGVLAHISGLFSSRGFNIDSLAVGETQDASISRITIIVNGDDRIIEQVNKQLNKLIDVIKVRDLTNEEHIERELLLVKVAATASTRSQILQVVDIFKAKIVNVTPSYMIIEITGEEEKVGNILNLLKPYGIKDIARTGHIALSKGE
jgi:acetolactate synthase-1/3 small subunit